MRGMFGFNRRRYGRSSKGQYLVSISILVLTLCLTVGYASFSTNLTIRSSATVTPDSSTFNVDFSNVSTGVVTTGGVTGTPSSGATAGTASIDNSADPVIKDLTASFTAPGQSVTYSFYAYNAGEFIAYLTNIGYFNAEGATVNKKCTAKSGTTQSTVDQACAGITLAVSVGGKSATGTTTVSNHPLAVGTAEAVIITISYASGSNQADGDFSVSFGDIQLTYSSVDNESGDSSGDSSSGLIISLSGSTLYITDNTQNDDVYDYILHMSGYGNLTVGQVSSGYDLSNLDLGDGEYQLYVERYSYDGYDSVVSNTLTYNGSASSGGDSGGDPVEQIDFYIYEITPEFVVVFNNDYIEVANMSGVTINAYIGDSERKLVATQSAIGSDYEKVYVDLSYYYDNYTSYEIIIEFVDANGNVMGTASRQLSDCATGGCSYTTEGVW